MGVFAALGISASGRSPLTGDQANGVVQGTISAVGPTKPFAFYGPMNLVIWGEFTTTLNTTAASLAATVLSAGVLAAGASIKSTLVPYGTVASVVSGTDVTLKLPTYTYYGLVTNGVARVRELEATGLLLGATVSGLGVTSSQTVSSIVTASVAKNINTVNATRGTVALSAVTNDQQQNTDTTPYEFALAAAGAVPSTAADAAAVFTSSLIGLVGSIQLERSFDGGQTWIVCNIGGAGALAQWSTAAPVSLSFGEPERGVLYRLNQTALTTSAGTALKYRISETGQAATTLSVPTI